MSIVPVTSEDIPELVALVECCYLKYNISIYGDRKTYGREDKDVVIKNLLGKPEIQMVKYLEPTSGGIIIASIYVEKQGDALYTGLLLVKPGFQGGGVGKKMMAYAEEVAKQNGCNALKLDVLSLKTDAVEWYEKQGFVETGRFSRLPNYTGNPTIPVELVVMSKTL